MHARSQGAKVNFLAIVRFKISKLILYFRCFDSENLCNRTFFAHLTYFSLLPGRRDRKLAVVVQVR